jgi:hypothetical protein
MLTFAQKSFVFSTCYFLSLESSGDDPVRAASSRQARVHLITIMARAGTIGHGPAPISMVGLGLVALAEEVTRVTEVASPRRRTLVSGGELAFAGDPAPGCYLGRGELARLGPPLLRLDHSWLE